MEARPQPWPRDTRAFLHYTHLQGLIRGHHDVKILRSTRVFDEASAPSKISTAVPNIRSKCSSP